MKPPEKKGTKRTTTETGLGRVTGDARDVVKRSPAPKGASEAPTSASPAAAPAASDAAAASDAPASARNTRPLVSGPAGAAGGRKQLDTKMVNTKALAEADRVVLNPPPGEARDRRAPTLRQLASESGEIRRPPGPHEGSMRAPPLETPRSPGVESRRPPAGTLRPIEGRPVLSVPPGKPEGSGRLVRASIRVDEVGPVRGVADALTVADRRVPTLARTKAEIAEAPIDHRAGFLLAHIDGVTSVQGLVDIAGMPANEVREILERLCRLGIVGFR